MSRAPLRLALLAACLAVAPSMGCRSVRALVVTPEEHAAFKPTRTRATLEERMHAAEEYLARYPDGMFAADVRRSYLRADEALWISKKGSVVGLESYLATLPAGPHAKVARRELDAKRAARVDLLGRGAKSTEERLAAAAAARVRAREALGTWIRRFSDPAIFGAPMADAPRDLVVPWSLGLPQPKCVPQPNGGRVCTKLVTETFEIPKEGEREMVLEMEVTESAAGGVCGVALSGPSLFARWEEASARRALDLDGPRMREALMRTVASMARSMIDTRPGAVECGDEEPVHHSLEAAFHCGPLGVGLTASEDGGGDDLIYLSTAYLCSSP